MFFDIGIGLLIASAVGIISASGFSLWLIAIGVIGSLWPDIDFLFYIAKRYVRGTRPIVNRWATNHRDLLHRPLALTPLVVVGVWAITGPMEAIVFGLATIAHFTHDTIGHGWGIRLLWPLDNRFYCYRRVGSRPYAFYRWMQIEQIQMIGQFGRDKWMQQSYGQMSSDLKKELIVMATGIIAVIIWYASR